MKNYDPFGLAPKSNRNPLKAALAVAPQPVPMPSGRIGSLPKPRLDPAQLELQQAGFDPHAMDGEMWAGSRNEVLRVPPSPPQLPPPSPVPQGRPTPPNVPINPRQYEPRIAQTAYDYLPSFSSMGQIEAPPVMPQGMLPNRPQIQQSYAMPTQRPGYLPQGMQQAPMPQYAPGGVIDNESQQLMRAVMHRQLMDQLNAQQVNTSPGFADGAMQLLSGLVPGSAKYLDSQVANMQNNRLRNAQLMQQENDNRRGWTQQMLQGIAANDPLSIAAQNQLFNQQSDWQKNQIAGVNAGTNAFKAEDDANAWRAQLPSQQWVSQQGAINSLLGQQNQSDANRYNFLNLEAQRQARQAQAQQEQAQAEADRIQRWKIAQLQAQQNQNDLLFRERNSVRQYGADGSKAKAVQPMQIAKSLQAQFFNKDNTPRMSDAAQLKPAMQAYLRNNGVPEEMIDSYLLPYANVLNTPPEVKDKGFDIWKMLEPKVNAGDVLNAATPAFDLISALAGRSGGQQTQATQDTVAQAHGFLSQAAKELKSNNLRDPKVVQRAQALAKKAGVNL